MEYDQRIHDAVAAARSLLDWWALAGVDCAVADVPRGWLQQEVSATPVAASVARLQQAEIAASPAGSDGADIRSAVPATPDGGRFALPASIPETLDDYVGWLMEDDAQPETAFAARRIRPDISVGLYVLLVTDMPSTEDMAAGRLLSGSEGDLALNMLRAIGVDGERAGMASLLLARPPGGVGDDGHWAHAAERMRLLLTLARPRLLLLLGDRTNRALCQATRGENWDFAQSVKVGDDDIRAIPLPAAFVMLQQPDRKAAAWKVLRRAVTAR